MIRPLDTRLADRIDETASRKESELHTITVSIQGDVSVSESVEVNDAEALPLFINLKAILRSEEQPKPRRGRPRKARAVDELNQTPVAANPPEMA